MPPLETPSPGLTINDISCSIYTGPRGDQGGIIEQWTDNGLEVRIEFLVKWNDRIAFIQALRGVAGIDPNGNVTRTDPWSLPNMTRDLCPDVPPYNQTPYFWDSYICVGTDAFRPIKPMTDQDGSVTGVRGWVYYDSVIIGARFAVTPYQTGPFNDSYNYGDDLSGYPYTTVKGKASGEAFKAWVNTYIFIASRQPADDVVFLRPRQEFTITRYMMPFVDTKKYDGLIGKVNLFPITIGSTEYPPESILYMGYEPEPVADPSTGLLFYNIHHTVLANGPVIDEDGQPEQSWNVFLDKSGEWSRIGLRTDITQSLYEMRDLVAAIWPETEA